MGIWPPVRVLGFCALHLQHCVDDAISRKEEQSAPETNMRPKMTTGSQY